LLQASTYQLWHGIIPMADFRRTADPDEFLVGGERGYAIDRLGRRYLDARSAMWNVTLGYSCEPVKEAMRRQLDELPSGTILRFESVPDVAVRYAEALAGSLPDPLNYVRFGNTGSQLTEAAVMLSRFYRRMTGERDRNHVIALDGSYHGSGPLASALSGEPVIHDYSAPLDDHVRHIVRPAPGGCGTDDAAPCDGGCVRPLVDLVGGLGAERVTAMIVEPVLGSHVLPLTGHYLTRVAAECRSRGIHFIADEVTTGAGRTGAMTASERAGLTPDMMVLGKGISAGYFPLAALAVSESIFAALAGPGRPLNFPHGSTTDGHPIGMAAGLAVLDIITADGFFEGVRETGHFLRDLIVESFSARAEVAAVRGRGLMLGVEFVHDDGSAWDVYDIDDLRRTCRDHGLLTSVAHNLLPLLPPLTISRDECVELVDRLGRSLDELRKRGTTGAKARGKTDGRRR
jgi:adenosylmethionine-8-amino-7-oxononanoate aminotransferase